MADINDLPSKPIRNSRVNSIDTLIAKSNTDAVYAFDRLIGIMKSPTAKDSDVLNATKSYLQFYIAFRDKKEEWEDRKLKRELLQLNLKRAKSEGQPTQAKEIMGFSEEYDGSNDGFLAQQGSIS